MSSNAARRGDQAIRVDQVSKHYTMYERPEDRFKQMVVPRVQRLVGRTPRQYFRDFAALHDISFEVGRGETVGIIGRNGSGKSTLLQIICGTLQPTSGTVEVNGRIAALLELGAGFNPEFTGRENVFLNASILGVPRQEMEWRFDDIARFADIGAFIDQPVKTYSSGMYVRLAFATAINVDPDILVVDEALSVGDEAFQRKCFARIEDIKDKGGTILFVSHGASTVVQLCTRAIFLDAGQKVLEGTPKMVVSNYQRFINITDEAKRASARNQLLQLGDLQVDAEVSVSESSEKKEAPSLEAFDPNLVSQSRVDYEPMGAQIHDLKILSVDGKETNILERGRRYIFQYRVTYDSDQKGVAFGMLIKTIQGVELAGTGTNLSDNVQLKKRRLNVTAGQTALVRMPFDCRLTPGAYFVNCGAGALVNDEPVQLHRIMDGLMFRVTDDGERSFSGPVDLGIVPEIVVLATSGAVVSQANGAGVE